jgi:periplasmic protein TonB
MTPQQEREKNIKAGLATAGVNILILLIMIFAAAWQSPGTGPGDYPGIEVNLGYDEQGSGAIEPATPIGTEEAKTDQNPPAEPVQEETVPEASPSPAVVEEIKPAPIEERTFTDPNSDVSIKEEKEKPVEKPAEKKPVVIPDKPVEKPVEKKPAEKPKVDSRAVYQGKTTTTPAPAGDAEGKNGTPGNQGDDVGKEGNKGVPGGTEGAAVYKGRPGGGDGGTGLDLYGWEWDNTPKPNTPDNETGRIVFEVEVDENGELIRYRKESGSVSAAAERACIEAIQKLTFTKKSGAKVPDISKGRIIFVLRAQ